MCVYTHIYIYIYIYTHVCMYVAIEEKNRETILSSLQACFVIGEWAIKKQACRDESIVSLFFPPVATYITLYFYVSSTVKRKNQYTDFLYIYISASPPPSPQTRLMNRCRFRGNKNLQGVSCLWRGILRNFHVISARTKRLHLYSASFLCDAIEILYASGWK